MEWELLHCILILWTMLTVETIKLAKLTKTITHHFVLSYSKLKVIETISRFAGMAII